MIANYYYAESIGDEINEHIKDFNNNNISIFYGVLDKDNEKTYCLGGADSETTLKYLLMILIGFYKNSKYPSFKIFTKKVFKEINKMYKEKKIIDT